MGRGTRVSRLDIFLALAKYIHLHIFFRLHTAGRAIVSARRRRVVVVLLFVSPAAHNLLGLGEGGGGGIRLVPLEPEVGRLLHLGLAHADPSLKHPLLLPLELLHRARRREEAGKESAVGGELVVEVNLVKLLNVVVKIVVCVSELDERVGLHQKLRISRETLGQELPNREVQLDDNLNQHLLETLDVLVSGQVRSSLIEQLVVGDWTIRM